MASRAYNLREFVRMLESWGLTDVLLPFLLIFVIIFALLQKTKVLGANRKNLNAAVALVIGLLVVIPHVLGIYPPGGDVVDIMNKALPNVSLIIVALLMVLILIGLLGGEATWIGGSLSGWIAIIALIAVIWIFGSAAGWWRGASWFYRFFGADAVAIIVMLLVFAIIVWWVTREPGEAGKEMTGNFISRLGDMFSKGK
jgi:hypothetical protein